MTQRGALAAAEHRADHGDAEQPGDLTRGIEQPGGARYPRLVECAPEMTTAEPEFHYRFGIDLFVAGVQAMAARP